MLDHLLISGKLHETRLNYQGNNYSIIILYEITVQGLVGTIFMSCNRNNNYCFSRCEVK